MENCEIASTAGNRSHGYHAGSRGAIARRLSSRALERDARRHSRKRVGAGELHLHRWCQAPQGSSNLKCLVVLDSLQMRVDQVVERVQVVDRHGSVHGLAQRCRGGPAVPVDRLFPQTEPREDVRRHVQRMWNVRRDLAVSTGHLQRVRRQCRVVVRMNDVVICTGMIAMACEYALGEFSGTFLLAHRSCRQDPR